MASPAIAGVRLPPPSSFRLFHGARSLFRLDPGASQGKLSNRPLDVEFNAGHPGETVDIVVADRASAEPHVGRHQVERLHHDADIFQDQRIGDRTVLP